MGLNPTGPYYKGFTFDGDSSKDYGVFLTGEGVFNAPERSVEEISIPGRNGNYILDLGRFENILVTYKAGLVDYNEADFADRISAVRNWLCSKVGYQRLEDEYNPGEYRLAAYKNGVELEHFDLKTGEFSITFNCKPQRWLTSGETAVAVANNGTLTNPELFDSEPLLAVKGYGDIAFNGYGISIGNVTIGDVVMAESVVGATPYVFTLNTDFLNVGDSVTVDVGVIRTDLSVTTSPKPEMQSYTFTDTNALCTTIAAGLSYEPSIETSVEPYDIVVGTSSSQTNTVSGTLSYRKGGTTFSVTVSITQTVSYNGSTHEITFSVSASASTTQTGVTVSVTGGRVFVASVTGHSTKSALGNPTYIGCDLGECWMESGGSIVSLNSVISLGSDLPKLAPGTNTFTYDNTITELKVTPRWWKV